MFCERKKIFLELWQYRFLMPHIPVAKAELKLSPLLDKAEFHQVLDVSETASYLNICSLK
jgi:hypothetical protein